MKPKTSLLLFFLSLLVIVPLGYSTDIMDNSLIPKYILLGFVLIAAVLLVFKQLKNRFQLRLPEIALIAYLTFCLPSIFFAINSSEAIYESSKIFLFVVSYFLIRYFLKVDEAKSLSFIPLFSAIAFYLALTFSVEEFFKALRLNESLSDSAYLITGLSGHKNLLSAWVLILIPLSSIGLYNKQNSLRIFYKITIALQVIVILVLQTRADYIALILGVFTFIFLFFISKKRYAKKLFISGFYLLGILLTFSIVLILFTPFFENTLSSIQLQSSSAQERLILWSKSIQLIKSHWLFGLGGGNWKVIFPSLGLDGLYRAELNNVIFLRPHNDLIWIFVEHGIFSLLAYLSFVLLSIRMGLQSIVCKENIQLNSILIAGIVAYLAMSCFDFPMERIEHQIGLAFMFAVLIQLSEKHSFSKEISLPKVAYLIPTLLILAFCCFLGFKRSDIEKSTKILIASMEAKKYVNMIEHSKNLNTKWVQLDNNAVPLVWYEGVANFSSGKQLEASKNFDNALQLNPYNFNVLNNAGSGLFVQKNYAKAEEYYLKALTINSTFDDAKLNLVATYINTQNWERAKYWMQQISTKTQRSENLQKLILSNS